MDKIKEYFNVYKSAFKLNIKSIMIYDADFIIGIIAMIIKTFINFFMLLILFRVITNINGWDFNHILFIYGFSTTSFAIWHCFFINTITIPYYIKTGEFDRFLSRPYNPLFLIMIEGFDEDGWGELIFGIIVSVISIIRLNIASYILLFLPIMWFASSLIYAGISIMLSIISFFTIDNIDITDITLQLNNYSKYPLDIYSKTLKIIFTFVFPIGFASFYPSLMFIDISVKNRILLIICIVAICILFFALSCYIWNKSLKKYTSSGY